MTITAYAFPRGAMGTRESRNCTKSKACCISLNVTIFLASTDTKFDTEKVNR